MKQGSLLTYNLSYPFCHGIPRILVDVPVMTGSDICGKVI